MGCGRSKQVAETADPAEDKYREGSAAGDGERSVEAATSTTEQPAAGKNESADNAATGASATTAEGDLTKAERAERRREERKKKRALYHAAFTGFAFGSKVEDCEKDGLWPLPEDMRAPVLHKLYATTPPKDHKSRFTADPVPYVHHWKQSGKPWEVEHTPKPVTTYIDLAEIKQQAADAVAAEAKKNNNNNITTTVNGESVSPGSAQPPPAAHQPPHHIDVNTTSESDMFSNSRNEPGSPSILKKNFDSPTQHHNNPVNSNNNNNSKKVTIPPAGDATPTTSNPEVPAINTASSPVFTTTTTKTKTMANSGGEMTSALKEFRFGEHGEEEDRLSSSSGNIGPEDAATAEAIGERMSITHHQVKDAMAIIDHRRSLAMHGASVSMDEMTSVTISKRQSTYSAKKTSRTSRSHHSQGGMSRSRTLSAHASAHIVDDDDSSSDEDPYAEMQRLVDEADDN